MAAVTSAFPHTQDSCPSCPFCPYMARSHDENDMYMLLQHLELSHPEDGESPFIAREASPPGQRRRSRSSASSRSAVGRHNRSNSLTPTTELQHGDDFYLDCPLKCGEAVHIRELDHHLELHDIEDLSFDEMEQACSDRQNASASHFRESRSLERAARERAASDQPSSRRSGELLALPDSSRSRKHPDSSSFRSLKECVLGPAPRKTRHTEFKPKPGSVRRLGRAELGPHAFEEQMPAWLYKQLQRGPNISRTNTMGSTGRIVQVESVANESPGIVPILAQLYTKDSSVSKVFLCHPSVKHIFKTPREGGFCGYRNIQMLISFMQGTRYPGCQYFPGRTPSIPRLQDMIESAWDLGFNSIGRVETGGIRGTRKYIGTPEAQALFDSLSIGCEATAFNKSRNADRTKVFVHDYVYEAVRGYFLTGVTDHSPRVCQTGLAPLYFQHPGHSLTIIGLEVKKKGSMSLLVLDPMFKTPPGVTRLIGTRPIVSRPDKLLKAFRRGDTYLGKYNSFEILKLLAPAPERQRPLPGPSS